ncbi:MAG TPA: peroxidase family protein, partial [Sediminibacterium sp.]|nr:peroxidase family protein [Sediminibacterium sp.]
KFLIGETIADDDVPKSFFNDLPRKLDGINPAKALIGDPRNDENLAVAQIHLAFLKFHNAVVDLIRSRRNNQDIDITKLRLEAREIVVLHYQSIVLHDFIKRFVDANVYERVIKNNNPQFFKVVANEMAIMPIEFSGAAYRWHTLIRDPYNWNRVFNSANTPKTGALRFLFQFTGLQNNDEFIGFRNIVYKALSSNWIVDWTRLFDFTHRGLSKGEGFNLTEPLDTHLVKTLHNFGPPNAPLNLAVKNLVRGSRIGIPSAQDIASELGISPLSPDELLNNSKQRQVLLDWEFQIKTPLWYYLNREAEVLGNSLRFGPLASTIICEVFHGLTKGSRRSILDPENIGWKPDAALMPSNESFYSFTDLLWFVKESKPQGDTVDELNPIG